MINGKVKAKVTLTARIKRAGSDEWVDHVFDEPVESYMDIDPSVLKKKDEEEKGDNGT